MRVPRTRLALLSVLAALLLQTGCNNEKCTPYQCSSVNPANGATLNICEGEDDYIRLDDEKGNEVYECFCDTATMKEVARRICSEGAVCRKAQSACSTSGDCCADLHCTYNVCG